MLKHRSSWTSAVGVEPSPEPVVRRHAHLRNRLRAIYDNRVHFNESITSSSSPSPPQLTPLPPSNVQHIAQLCYSLPTTAPKPPPHPRPPSTRKPISQIPLNTIIPTTNSNPKLPLFIDNKHQITIDPNQLIKLLQWLPPQVRSLIVQFLPPWIVVPGPNSNQNLPRTLSNGSTFNKVRTALRVLSLPQLNPIETTNSLELLRQYTATKLSPNGVDLEGMISCVRQQPDQVEQIQSIPNLEQFISNYSLQPPASPVVQPDTEDMQDDIFPSDSVSQRDLSLSFRGLRGGRLLQADLKRDDNSDSPSPRNLMKSDELIADALKAGLPGSSSMKTRRLMPHPPTKFVVTSENTSTLRLTATRLLALS